MHSIEVYVGLGGNIGDSISILNQAICEIFILPEVCNLQISGYYRTSPVSPIPQNDYVNAVCRFTTTYSMRDLLACLQKIELKLGKIPKDKNAPRVIDLDLLLYGLQTNLEDDLQVPHPEWKNRLFVLIPMLDLTEEVLVPDPDSPKGCSTLFLRKYIDAFHNNNHEIIRPID